MTLFFRINSNMSSSNKLYSECLKSPCLASAGIYTAKLYGLNTVAGRKIASDGNCVFSFSSDQMEIRFFLLLFLNLETWYQNFRECYKNCIKNRISVQQNRQLSAEIGKQMFRGTPFDIGLSDAEWNSGWEKMKKSGTYQVPYFGDLMFMSMYLMILSHY